MNRAEEKLQRQLVAYLRAALPAPWIVFHPANGGGRSKAEAGILKAMGVLAGMPDLLLIGPGDPSRVDVINGWRVTKAYYPLIVAIEVKAPPKMLKSGKQSAAKPSVSDAQRDVIATLGQCGIPTLIVRDLDEAIEALKNLGVPLKGRLL